MIQAHYKREDSFAMHYLTCWYSIPMFNRHYLQYCDEAAQCTNSCMELNKETASTLNSAEVSNI